MPVSSSRCLWLEQAGQQCRLPIAYLGGANGDGSYNGDGSACKLELVLVILGQPTLASLPAAQQGVNSLRSLATFGIS